MPDPSPAIAPPHPEIHIPMDENMHELRRTDEKAFEAEADALARDAEEMRLKYMRSFETRHFIAATLGMFVLLGGAAGFGWFFLVDGELVNAVGSVIIAAVVPLFLHAWAKGSVHAYARAYKSVFMPKMAHAMGGFRYNATGGVSEKVLPVSGVAPDHDQYHAEDCFMGRYKGMKIIFSEARLYKRGAKAFRGMFVLLETPRKIMDGHLIITADRKMAQAYGQTRWSKLTGMAAPTTNPEWNRFVIFTDHADQAGKIVTEKLLKELSEAADAFENKKAGAPVTVSIFRQKYVFMMIPYEEDMFEVSGLLEPIRTKANAQERHKEIEKIMEAIDVFDVFGIDPASPGNMDPAKVFQENA